MQQSNATVTPRRRLTAPAAVRQVSTPGYFTHEVRPTGVTLLLRRTGVALLLRRWWQCTIVGSLTACAVDVQRPVSTTTTDSSGVVMRCSPALLEYAVYRARGRSRCLRIWRNVRGPGLADRDLVTPRIVRWALADEPLTDAEVSSARERLFASMPSGAPRAKIERAVNDIVAPELLSKVRSAISRALWDDAGRLWLGRFDAPARGLAEASDWVVLDAPARPVGRIRLPELARLESVRGNELLVSVRDSVDVQTVQVWRVVP